MSKKYDNVYQATHDIDWFCRIGNQFVHCASNGGRLPEKVNDREMNGRNQEIVAGLKDVVSSDQVIINRGYVYERLGKNESPEAFGRYVSSFVSMAKKGFLSFDRVEGEDIYRWVAKPNSAIMLDIATLPEYDTRACGDFYRKKEVLHVDCLDQADRINAIKGSSS